MRSLDYLLLFILLLGAGQSNYAQRCGGSIDYIPRDKKGELINVGKIKVNYVRQVSAPGSSEPYIYTEDNSNPSINKNQYEVNTLHISTGCGMKLVEVNLEYEARRMILQFHNVPWEVNFFVDSLPFEKGTFEIDFKGELNQEFELTGVDLNRHGIKLTDGTNVLGLYAKNGNLVANTSWKKTKSKAKLTPETARPYSREKTN